MKRYVLVRGVPGRLAPHPNIKIGETGGQPQRPLGMKRNFEATKAEEMWDRREEVVELTHAVRKLIRGGDVEALSMPGLAASPAEFKKLIAEHRVVTPAANDGQSGADEPSGDLPGEGDGKGDAQTSSPDGAGEGSANHDTAKPAHQKAKKRSSTSKDEKPAAVAAGGDR